MPESDELHYLAWLAQNIDFGPAHEDVMMILNQNYETATGYKVPDGWRDDEE